VYDLLDFTLQKLQREVPILLERDFNIPELEVLESEMTQLRNIQNKVLNPMIV